ncbi:hypothetical protein VOM14_02815 [Paraburkholderia sp. MPAMCS5]|nr:hypothetical protein [Paraburkholderia sp. MPAMCS5]
MKLSTAVSSGGFLYSFTYGSMLEGTTTANLGSSFAPAINAGFAYNIDKH